MLEHSMMSYSMIYLFLDDDVEFLIFCRSLTAFQAIYLKYAHPDNELQNYSVLVMDMLRADQSSDAHALVLFTFF